MILILGLIFIYFFILLLSFYFSGNEAGFISLNQEKYQLDIKNHHKKAFVIKPFVDNLDIVLGVTLLGNNLANICATYVGEYLWFELTGGSSLLIFTVLSATLFLVIAEVLPKILFKKYANQILYQLGNMLLFFAIFFRPFVFLITRLSSFLIKPLISFKKEKKLSKEDFNDLLDDIVEEGLIEEKEKHFLNMLSSLSKTKVSEIMTPLVDLYFINKSQDISQVVDEIFKENRELIPVYEERIDNIVGLVSAIDIFNASKKKKIGKDFMKEVVYFPEINTLDKLYALFFKNFIKSVVVVDEYGGCTGLVTEKDVIDYIFGFRNKNKDQKFYRERLIKEIAPLVYEISTVCDIEYFNQFFGLHVPKKDYKTLAGYINDVFGYLPKEGESKKTKSFMIHILKSEKTSVKKIKIQFFK